MKLEDLNDLSIRGILICGVLTLLLFITVNRNAHWRCYNESSENWSRCYEDSFRGGSYLFIIPLIVTGLCFIVGVVTGSFLKRRKKDIDNHNLRPPFQSGL